MIRVFCPQDEASESRMRVAGLIEQVQGVQDRRSALYQSYDDAINKYKSSKDSNSFMSNRKKIDADHKQLTTQISALQAKLKSEGSDISEKVLYQIPNSLVDPSLASKLFWACKSFQPVWCLL